MFFTETGIFVSIAKDSILEVHHLKSRQIGGDRPDNLITLCTSCHQLVSKGELKIKIKASIGLKAETFMTMVRWRIVNLLRQTNNNVSHTYGYLTKCKRISFGISKSHVNDAFVIAGGSTQQRIAGYIMQQVKAYEVISRIQHLDYCLVFNVLIRCYGKTLSALYLVVEHQVILIYEVSMALD
jgi:hypothetical protein